MTDAGGTPPEVGRGGSDEVRVRVRSRRCARTTRRRRRSVDPNGRDSPLGRVVAPTAPVPIDPSRTPVARPAARASVDRPGPRRLRRTEPVRVACPLPLRRDPPVDHGSHRPVGPDGAPQVSPPPPSADRGRSRSGPPAVERTARILRWGAAPEPRTGRSRSRSRVHPPLAAGGHRGLRASQPALPDAVSASGPARRCAVAGRARASAPVQHTTAPVHSVAPQPIAFAGGALPFAVRRPFPERDPSRAADAFPGRLPRFVEPSRRIPSWTAPQSTHAHAAQPSSSPTSTADADRLPASCTRHPLRRRNRRRSPCRSRRHAAPPSMRRHRCQRQSVFDDIGSIADPMLRGRLTPLRRLPSTGAPSVAAGGCSDPPRCGPGATAGRRTGRQRPRQQRHHGAALGADARQPSAASGPAVRSFAACVRPHRRRARCRPVLRTVAAVLHRLGRTTDPDRQRTPGHAAVSSSTRRCRSSPYRRRSTPTDSSAPTIGADWVGRVPEWRALGLADG